MSKWVSNMYLNKPSRNSLGSWTLWRFSLDYELKWNEPSVELSLGKILLIMCIYSTSNTKHAEEKDIGVWSREMKMESTSLLLNLNPMVNLKGFSASNPSLQHLLIADFFKRQSWIICLKINMMLLEDCASRIDFLLISNRPINTVCSKQGKTSLLPLWLGCICVSVKCLQPLICVFGTKLYIQSTWNKDWINL